MEFPQLLEEVDKMEKLVTANGIKFKRLKSDTSFEYYLSQHENHYKTEKRIYHDLDPRGYGWASPNMRWCTRVLKTDVISRYFSTLRKSYKIINLIGIASDEVKRLNRKNQNLDTIICPLAEWGWTEAMCLDYCYKNGITWGGLYEHFNRVSCWCCPLQSLSDLRELYHNFPDLWNELKRLDRTQWRVYKQYETVDSLERRFAFEDECISKNIPTSGKRFFDELHRITPPQNLEGTYIKMDFYKNRKEYIK